MSLLKTFLMHSFVVYSIPSPSNPFFVSNAVRGFGPNFPGFMT